jgi:hypothetical protein
MPKCQVCSKNEVSFKELFKGKEMCSECEQNELKVPITAKLKGFFVLFALCFIIFQCCESTENNHATVEKAPKTEKPNGRYKLVPSRYGDDNIELIKDDTKKISKLSYKIIHEYHIRTDGAITYYVLINGVDLSNDGFKSRIKSTIDDITAKKGKKISIEFLNDKDVLELYYKSPYVTAKTDRDLSKSQHNQINTSLIASFDGQLSTGSFFNTLSFFPSAFDETPKIGKYVDVIGYDPQ